MFFFFFLFYSKTAVLVIAAWHFKTICNGDFISIEALHYIFLQKLCCIYFCIYL